MSLRPQHSSQQQRVVADGWGRQASGSVFCAESSLRFIYESQPEAAPGTTAAAISSLASGEYARSTLKDAKAPTMYGTSYDKLHDGSTAIYGQSSLMMANMLAAKLDPAASTRGADGVDLFEAEIAKACAQITRQAPSLPHSFRECSVCLTQNAYAQIAVCGHTFHSKCFLRWFRTNRSCPLCRGPVDKIQLAPVVSVQDELEALMAEMDDEVVDPLMENPDLISFLGADFDDADMDMMALDDMPAVHDQPMKIQECAHDDVSMEDDQEQAPLQPPQAPAQAPSTMGSFSMQLQMPVQYAPTSTMPNYWNVLNQGMSLPPVMPAPIMPAPQQQQHVNAAPQAPTQQSRMVHIAPKPDGHFHHQHTHQHQHIYGHAQLPPASHPFATARAASPIAPTAAVAAASAPRVVSCRCTGGCRNGRCACVKEGAMCGVSCRCTSCKNPFLMVKAAGADIDALFKDACFMHNVSKTRDMVQRMQEPVDVPCCERTIKVIDCVQGYKCTACGRTYDFSWCMNKLLDHDKTPRNHCEICKRCCDHRDVHCNDCGRCYFAGVAASLPCPCKESSRKRRDNQNEVSAVKEESNNAVADGEEKEGECSIM